MKQFCAYMDTFGVSKKKSCKPSKRDDYHLYRRFIERKGSWIFYIGRVPNLSVFAY